MWGEGRSLTGVPRPSPRRRWIKPKKEDGSTLERATLDRHSKGERKNDPGAVLMTYELPVN